MIVCLGCGHLRTRDRLVCPDCDTDVARVEGLPAYAPEYAEQGGGFRPEYFATLARLEADNFWFRSRNELIGWALRRYFGSPNSLLEVGCGTGFVLSGIARMFPHARLCGSEIFSAGLRFAKARVPTAEFLQMDARVIPFKDEFDVVCAFDVIEHIREDDVVLGQLRAAVKPGGGVLLTVPQHQWLWSVADVRAQHQRRYEAKELHQKVRSAGFEILRTTSFVSLLLPAMTFSRLTSGQSESSNELREYRIGTVANTVLGGAMAVERGLIAAGLSFSFGGSRLVAARRK